jgi:hypothetical protein
LGTVARKVIISFAIAAETKAELSKRAKAEERSLSQYCDRALTAHLDQMRKLEKKARRGS